MWHKNVAHGTKTSHQVNRELYRTVLLTLISQTAGVCESSGSTENFLGQSSDPHQPDSGSMHQLVIWCTVCSGEDSCRNLLPSPVLESYQKYREKLETFICGGNLTQLRQKVGPWFILTSCNLLDGSSKVTWAEGNQHILLFKHWNTNQRESITTGVTVMTSSQQHKHSNLTMSFNLRSWHQVRAVTPGILLI